MANCFVDSKVLCNRIFLQPLAWKLMSPSKLSRTIEAVKDKLSIGLAKVNYRACLLSDLDVAILKATKHDEYPADERHIKIILKLTCYSSPYVRSCVKTISRRLRKTKTWTVALKTLMLVHRLLHNNHVAFEEEFFFTPWYRACLLDMSNFLDKTRLYSWDYSSFVRTYALYLNDQLEKKVKARKYKHGYSFTSRNISKEKIKPGQINVMIAPVQEMKMEQIFTRIYCLMESLELFLNCRPTGSAKTNRVVVKALHPIIKESFTLYNDIIETITVLIGRFMELNIQESIKVHEILCKISKQFDKLDSFYNWSISCGIARCSEYPEVVKIPQIKLDKMEKYIQAKSVEEKNMKSIKALPLSEGLPEETERSKEREIKMKIHEVGDLINFDDDDSPTTEEHPDKFSLSLFDGSSTIEPSPWVTFNDSDDWETELEQSVNHLSNQNETPTWSFGTLMQEYDMHRQREVNHKAGSDNDIGLPTMLALPAPPSQNDAANTIMIYPNFEAPMVITPPPYVQMLEMEMKQQLPTEQHVMWLQYTTNVMQGPVAYAMIQPHPYMYNQ